MGTYRPFPPPPSQTNFAQPPRPQNPNQTLLPPPSMPPSNPNPYSQHGYGGGGGGGGGGGSGPFAAQSYGGPYTARPPPPQYQYQPQPMPPMQSQQYYPQQFNTPPAPPPPPPPPDNIPPPPPLPPPGPAPPPPPPSDNDRKMSGFPQSSRQHQKGGGQPRDGTHGATNGRPSGMVETEEERRNRKKREFEKQKQEEKRRQMLKDSQAAMLQKTQMISGMKPHGSSAGSRMMDRKVNPLLAGERTDNRLKKPTTFLCKLKFRNELPDPTAQPKLLAMNSYKDQYTKYAITSIEKMHKPKLYLEPDLGIPLDLLDISVYNPPKKHSSLAPEDEELLRDSDLGTPIKPDGIKRKDRPTDKGVSWLVKTQYISPLSMDAAKLSITEKQAKEMRESKEGRNIFLQNLNNREKQIQAIEDSFKASKLRPVHQSNPKLEPLEILPLLPDLDRYDDRFVMVTFDGNPTADSEVYDKLDKTIRDDHEAKAIMKSFVASGSDPAKPERFLAYMAPAPDELSKDIYDESEDILYTWVREYHWDVRGDEADPTTYLVHFDEDSARYLPLPTKLILQKKRAKEGRSGDIEHYPPPSRVTVRRRESVYVRELEPEVKPSTQDFGGYSTNSKRSKFAVDDSEVRHKDPRIEEMDHFSDEEMSD